MSTTHVDDPVPPQSERMTDGWRVGETVELSPPLIAWGTCGPTEHAFGAVQTWIGGVSSVVGVLCPKCGEYRPVPYLDSDTGLPV